MLQTLKILFKAISKSWSTAFEVTFITFMAFLKGNEPIYMTAKTEAYRDKMTLQRVVFVYDE